MKQNNNTSEGKVPLVQNELAIVCNEVLQAEE